MMTAVICFLTLMVLLPLAVNEIGELTPWLARHLLRWGARLLASPDTRERYAEEWLANLDRVPGKLTKLLWVCGLLLWSVPQIRWQSRQRRARIAFLRRILRVPMDRKLGMAALAALAVVVGCGLAIAMVENLSLWEGTYLALLSLLNGTEPDLAAPVVVQVLYVTATLASLVLIPMITAMVVDTIVRIRLADSGSDRKPKSR